MKIENPLNGVLHFKFDTQGELTHAMIRMGEFYESPFEEIRGQRFTLEEYLARYEREYPGANYFADWNGYNIPADSIHKFFAENEARPDEIEVKEAMLGFWARPCEYVIATWDTECIAHEEAHALFYIDAIYEDWVRDSYSALWRLFPTLVARMETDLLVGGYTQAVLVDELNAYITTNVECLGHWGDGTWPSLVESDIPVLNKLRSAYQVQFQRARDRNTRERNRVQAP